MTDEPIKALIENYPSMTNKALASKLNVSLSYVNKQAQIHCLKKSSNHHDKLMKELALKRKAWFNQSIKPFTPTHIQQQLIYGSMLGDGYISKGANRSIHYHYQEHFCEEQRGYREWKLSILKDLSFNISGRYLRSCSHPYFNQLHRDLYDDNNIKVLKSSFLKQCTSLYFLLALYLDDGSLMITKRINHRQKKIYLTPSIVLYTLNFTREENNLLKDHINQHFNQQFIISSHPDGKKTLLKLNKVSDVTNFLAQFKSFVGIMPSMDYKLSLDDKELPIKEALTIEYPGYDIIRSSSSRTKPYSSEELMLLNQFKHEGYTDKEIAERLNRTYWSVVYKWADINKTKEKK
jgi:hypothetical protein